MLLLHVITENIENNKNCLILSVYMKSVKRAIFNYKFTECVYKDYLVKDRVSKLLKMSLSVILPI